MRNIIIILSISCILGCRDKTKTPKEQIMVFAGVGMKNAVSEIIDSFSIQHPDINVLSNWAPSGILAKQISQGQVPDIYISANKKWVNYVDSLGQIIDNKIMVVAKNELVLVVPEKSDMDSVIFNENLDFNSILDNSFLSIGDPAYVPVGAYALQSLKHYKLYSQVKSQLMPARDVRSALWVVELGKAPAGIVFRSEATTSEKVKTIAVIPSESHKPIYFIASQCKRSKRSNDFYSFLNTDKARNVWIKHGFY